MASAVYEKISTMTYGVELEYNNISQAEAVKAIEKATGGVGRYVGAHLHDYKVRMPDGREWTVETDASIRGLGCESVSPILTLADMPMLQEVVRELRKAGARPDSSCGLHIHIGAKDMSCAEVAKVCKLWWMGEDYMIQGCGTAAARVNSWCNKLTWGFAEGLCKAGTAITWKKMSDLYYHNCGRAWRQGDYQFMTRNGHYNEARYSALNLHNLLGYHETGYGKPTIEFRLFTATTHAGEVKANVLFALSVVAKALMTSRIVCNASKWNFHDAAMNWRTTFNYLGWTGDEFKVARFHFLKRAVGEM